VQLSLLGWSQASFEEGSGAVLLQVRLSIISCDEARAEAGEKAAGNAGDSGQRSGFLRATSSCRLLASLFMS
jgi:hypothetical protein